MSKPITPAEAKKNKIKAIPAEVIEAVNELIVKNLNGNGTQASVKYEDIKSLACQKLGPVVEWESGWLDIEDVFRQAGWLVTADSPGYNESYKEYFIFKAKCGHSND